jgi:hypothetical protein
MVIELHNICNTIGTKDSLPSGNDDDTTSNFDTEEKFVETAYILLTRKDGLAIGEGPPTHINDTLQSVKKAFEEAKGKGDGDEAEDLITDGDHPSSGDDSEVDLTIDTNSPESEPKIASTREGNLINDYTENDILHLLAFPHLFMLGEGFGSGPASTAATRHLMMQHTCVFAKNRLLLFSLFNQDQRHASARGLSTRIKNNPASFDAWAELVMDEDFEKTLEVAAANPESSEADEVLRRVQPFIRTVGKNVPFGPMERANGITALYAMTHRYSYPNVYYTIALDEVHSALVVRFSYPSTNNVDPVKFLEALRQNKEYYTNGQKVGVQHVEVQVPITNMHLHRLVAANPVAASGVFQLTTEAFMTELLGMPPLNGYGTTKRTVPLGSRRPGIFARLLAHYMVVEVQGRLSLHGHGVCWGVLKAAALQEGAANGTLRAMMAKILDKMITAHLPAAIHLDNLIREKRFSPVYRGAFFQPKYSGEVDDNNNRNTRKPTNNKIKKSKAEIDVEEESKCKMGEEFDMHVKKSNGATNIHKHSVTCVKKDKQLTEEQRKQRQQRLLHDEKKNEGKDTQEYVIRPPYQHVDSCRLAKPSGNPVDKTKPVELKMNIGNDEVIAHDVSHPTHDRTADRDLNVCPLAEDDKRIIAWELKRPNVYNPDDVLFTKTIIPRGESKDTGPQTEVAKSSPNEIVIDDVLDELNKLSKFDISIEDLKDLKTRFAALPLADAQDILSRIATRNGMVVEFSPALSGCLGCNTAIYILGAVEQAKAAMFYLVKYLNKDTVQLRNCLSIIHNARKHIRAYPSVADDTGTTKRSAQHFLTRCVNQLSLLMEVSDTQAAAHVLGMKSMIVTDKFWFVFILPAIRKNKHLYIENFETDDDTEGTWSDTNDDDDADEDFGMTDPVFGDESSSDEEDVPGAGNRKRGHTSSGSCTFFHCLDHTGAKTTVPVGQDSLYENRGDDPTMRKLNFYEWASIISVVAKPKRDGDVEPGDTKPNEDAGTEQTKEDNETAARNLRGRAPSKKFEFAEGSVLEDSHVQQIKSLLCTVVIAGGACPKYPGKIKKTRHGGITTSWKETSKKWVMFALCLLRPYEPYDGQEYSWRAYVEWVKELKASKTFISNYRLETMNNIKNGMRINNFRKRLLTKYRFRQTEVWNEQCPKPLPGVSQKSSNRDAGERLAKEAATEIDAILADAKKLEAHKKLLIEHAAKRGYLKSQLDTHTNLIGESANYDQRNFPAHIRGPQDPLFMNYDPDLHTRVKMSATKHDNDANQTKRSGPAADALERMSAKCPTGGTGDLINYADPPGESPPQLDRKPNKEHDEAINLVLAYFTAKSAHDLDPRLPLPKPPMLLIHGGPGVGKSFFANRLVGELRKMNKHVVSVAYTGVATTGLDNGMTICRFLFVGSLYSKGDAMVGQFETTNPNSTALERRSFADCLIVDEISMVGSTLFGNMEERLMQGRGNHTDPMGGMPTILVGDFFQMPPIGDFMLCLDIVRHLVGKSRKKVISASARGCEAFAKFQLRSFNLQMRAPDDPAHQARIQGMRELKSKYPITPVDFNSIKVLCEKDYKSRTSPWLFAPIVITANAERRSICYLQALRWGVIHSVPIIAWRAACRGTEWDNQSDLMKAAYRKKYPNMLTNYFVAGAGASLCNNINPERGLANGTQVIQDTITFAEDGLEMEDFYQRVKAAKGGDIILAPFVPITVNVRCFYEADVKDSKGSYINDMHRQEKAAWLKYEYCSLVDRDVVVPVYLDTNTKTKWNKIVLPSLDVAGEVIDFEIRTEVLHHPWAKTYQKTQSQTLSHLIIDMNKRPFNPPVMLSGAYVGYTRVTHSTHMRRMPAQKGGNFKHLFEMTRNPLMAVFFAGYDDDGIWDAKRAEQYTIDNNINVDTCEKEWRKESAANSKPPPKNKKNVRPSKQPTGTKRKKPSPAVVHHTNPKVRKPHSPRSAHSAATWNSNDRSESTNISKLSEVTHKDNEARALRFAFHLSHLLTSSLLLIDIELIFVIICSRHSRRIMTSRHALGVNTNNTTTILTTTTLASRSNN